MTVGVPMAGDAIRAYIARLRQLQSKRTPKHYNQENVASAAGMSKRAWIDYETGKTAWIRETALIAVLRYLQASFDDLRELSGDGVTAEEGRALAELRAARLDAAAAEEALRETLSTEEWNAYVEGLERRARELQEQARREEERISRLRG